jgi:RNA polymerase sigma-70 factor (ECF subfamily)
MANANLENLFKTCLREHRAIVFKVARAYTLTPEERGDLVQEILMQIWRSLPHFEGRSGAHTRFYRVALLLMPVWLWTGFKFE